MKGKINIKANNHLKKLNLSGGNDELKASLPARKFPDQNKEDKVRSKNAKKTLFCIIIISLLVSLKMKCHIDCPHLIEFLNKIHLPI